MSDRRMCSNRIVKSSRFLQMPLESQALYFHLIINADDDGVVEAYPVIRLLGTAPDSLKVLLAKNLIVQLNEDQVILVTDWLEHNYIRADRKIDSIYKNLIPKNIPTLESKKRADRGNKNTGIIGRPIKGHKRDGISKVKLSKVKLSKESINTPQQIANSFFSKEKHYEIIMTILKEKIDNGILEREIEKFILYWTEPNKSGTKVKWELEKTFEVKRRLRKWFENKQQWSKDKNEGKTKQLIL